VCVFYLALAAAKMHRAFAAACFFQFPAVQGAFSGFVVLYLQSFWKPV